MKLDTTSVRHKNRIRQQMIQIHQHRSQQNQIHLHPILPKESVCDKKRKPEVQKIMDESLHWVEFNALAGMK
jgi:hypothetical protein